MTSPAKNVNVNRENLKCFVLCNKKCDYCKHGVEDWDREVGARRRRAEK